MTGATAHRVALRAAAPARPSTAPRAAAPRAPLHELQFPAMGTRVRLLASDPSPLPNARAEVEQLAARLTRFDARSELCALNADPRPVVRASADLRAAVRVALRGAERTGGLADPTLLGPLERAGYGSSLAGVPRTPLPDALGAAPARHAARPHPAAAWRSVGIADGAGTIARPPGVRLDLGGSAKGFIADRAAALLAPFGPCAVDCGGDMRVHGAHEVLVAHPFGGEPAAAIPLFDAAVATSGVDARLWGAADHHLLDPATGTPAWTGVVSATALAPTAAEAEALAKGALLAGPAAGRALLAHHGGVLVLDDGTAALLGAATPRGTVAA
ncbi:MAG TPA: FAD:protein FMN transferase [Solirubrobacteraceae bacterium]|nr:FAD:protein FMN transferase [Solirubrobacteraceae bacterium]